MLLFITFLALVLPLFPAVSIHLMLLYIREYKDVIWRIEKFQYISCYSLSEESREGPAEDDVSIHLMLLFIFFPIVNCVLVFSFQYISCYSLSSTLIQFYDPVFSFNTSHVTLYPFPVFANILLKTRFNTSHVTLYPNPVVGDPLMPEFQYISCYSLSPFFVRIRSTDYCFNTSHVTLYLETLDLEIWRKKSFNTSHVTLYRYSLYPWSQLLIVSIHLMLLFIQQWKAKI